jgi:hypothetical protein
MADPEVDSAAGRNPAFRVMDVWPMSAKRADAHLGKWSIRLLPTCYLAERVANLIDVVYLDYT